MTSSLKGVPTKAKEAPSPYEVRLAPLDTNLIFQCLGVEFLLPLSRVAETARKKPCQMMSCLKVVHLTILCSFNNTLCLPGLHDIKLELYSNTMKLQMAAFENSPIM